MLILGIDTSCDDTSASVITDDFEILSSVVSSQDEVHGRFGGVVPELASRKHVENIIPIIDHALNKAGEKLSDIGLVAVTQGPGLVGSLVVGISAAKAISLAHSIPLLGVNHLEGHIASCLFSPDRPGYPFVALVVSGGHTNLYLAVKQGEYILRGQTLDDAAGEAFDKVAKLLGLGYPGGRVVEEAAKGADGDLIEFPRAYLGKDSFDFSFSGVKTAVRNFVKSKDNLTDELIRRIAGGFQEAVVGVLVEKTVNLALDENVGTVIVSGGVAANGMLRQRMAGSAESNGLKLIIPPRELCTDNAAMIAAVGTIRRGEGSLENLEMNAVSRWKI